MSILVFEGFDLYGNYGNSEQDLMSRRGFWNGAYENIDGLDFDSRFQGQAMRLRTDITSNLSQYDFIKVGSSELLNDTNTIVGGFAFMKEEAGATGDGYAVTMVSLYGESKHSPGADDVDYRVVIALKENPTTDFNLFCYMYNDYVGQPFMGGEVPNLLPGIYHYVEFEAKSDDPTHFKVWVNGKLEIDVSGLDPWPNQTDYSGFRSVYLHAAKANYHPGGFWIDDMYLLDALDASDGAVFQQRLGPIQIRPMPATGDGTPSEWLALSNGAKYLEIDEQPGPSDLDGSYVATSVAPQTQMFTVTAHDADLPILAVTSYAAIKQSVPATNVAKMAFIANDGTEQVDNKDTVLQGGYRLFWQDYTAMPGGNPLNVSNIQAAEWGVRSLEEPL